MYIIVRISAPVNTPSSPCTQYLPLLLTIYAPGKKAAQFYTHSGFTVLQYETEGLNAPTQSLDARTGFQVAVFIMIFISCVVQLPPLHSSSPQVTYCEWIIFQMGGRVTVGVVGHRLGHDIQAGGSLWAWWDIDWDM